jgi:hypothetical protein
MTKLKIEHRASKVRWTLLKTYIEEPIGNDIDLMCQWSENERKYGSMNFCVSLSEQPRTFRSTKPNTGQVRWAAVRSLNNHR